MADEDDLETRRLRYLKKRYLSDHLAILVEDQKCQSANRINNGGMQRQLRYLLSIMSWSELVDALEREVELLRRYGMKTQSKLVPEKNQWMRKRR